MFRIDTGTNSIQPLTAKSFGELNFRERTHLQEWIAKEPSCLGEELLIIQKEFAGFADTSERLDLLALDKSGCLVLIENKLDDTGRDVTWQALKYASYCSTLSKDQVLHIYQDYLSKHEPGANAQEKITTFLDADDYQDASINKGLSQRIILIAANFRKEVTSTVLWLLNFKLRVQCFQVRPYAMGDQLFLNIEQIIPTKAAEEFMIGMADKSLDEVGAATEEKARHRLRREFWTLLLQELSGKTTLYQNVSSGNANWIGAGSGVRGLGLNFSVGKARGTAELYIDRGDKVENEMIFDLLLSKKNEIEIAFGSPLIWKRLDERRACVIRAEIQKNLYNPDDWPDLIKFMADAMVRLEQAMKAPIANIGQMLKKKG